MWSVTQCDSSQFWSWKSTHAFSTFTFHDIRESSLDLHLAIVLGRGNRPMFPFMTFRETSCGAPFIITVGSLLLDPLATSYYHPANLHTWETLVTVLGFILLRIPSLGLGSACHGLLFFLIPVKFGPDETYVPIH